MPKFIAHVQVYSCQADVAKNDLIFNFQSAESSVFVNSPARVNRQKPCPTSRKIIEDKRCHKSEHRGLESLKPPFLLQKPDKPLLYIRFSQPFPISKI